MSLWSCMAKGTQNDPFREARRYAGKVQQEAVPNQGSLARAVKPPNGRSFEEVWGNKREANEPKS